MNAARRAALHAAMQAENVLNPRASDPVCLDFLCGLSIECDALDVSDASLGAAGADADEVLAASARALLSERRIRRASGLEAKPCSEAAGTAERPVTVATFAEALAHVRASGWHEVEVSRGFLRALGAETGSTERALRAAASAREPALDESLRSAAIVAGADAGLIPEAVESDALWRVAPVATAFGERISLFADAAASRRVAGVTFLPAGTARAGTPALEFADGPARLFGRREFFNSLGVDPDGLHSRIVRCEENGAQAAARWLSEGGRSDDVAADGALALQWPMPEDPAVVRAPRMTFSASRLNAFVKCPRRWFYEYLCDCLDELPSPQALYGRVFHAALETLHRDIRSVGGRQPDDVVRRLHAALDSAFGAAHADFSSQLEYETARLRARRVAEQYVRWLFAEGAEAPFEIAEIELRQTGTFGGHDFVGFIDRIDRPAGGGPITIFDYKTGRVEEDAHEYLRQVRSGEEAQLALYYAMRRALGDDVARIALVSVRDARDKTWMLALDIVGEDGKAVIERREREGVVRATCTTADLQGSLDALVARCTTLTVEGLARFEAGADPPCRYCTYERACRERPADGERIFAR